MKVRVGLFAIVAAALAVALVGCGGGGGPGAGVTVSAITDSDGQRLASTIDGNEQNPCGLSEISGLQPGQRVEIMLFKGGAPQYEQPLMFTADNKGVVPLVLFYDLGINPNTGQIDPSAVGAYTVEITSDGRTISTQSFSLGSGTKGASSRASSSGNISILTQRQGNDVFALGSVEDGGIVRVWGRGFQSGDKYALYVVRDERGWSAGQPMDDVTGSVEVVTVVDGQFSTVLWENASTQVGVTDFDVIAKKMPGDATTAPSPTTFAGGDVANGTTITGFTVQVADGGGNRIARVAATTAGQLQSVFEEGDSVAVWVNPPWRPLTPYQAVRKYVVLHQNVWSNDDILVDVTGRPETDLVRWACGNEYCCPVWYSAKGGRYDIVIDVDQDGRYDVATDILDNDVLVNGAVVARIAVGASRPLVVRNEPVNVYAKLVWSDGVPISGQTVTFAVRSGAGTLSASTATTDENGQATVTVTPTARGAELVVSASAKVKGQDDKEYPLTGECYIATKAAGDMTVTIK